MKNTLLILALGMLAVTARALDDTDGYRIIQKGDVVKLTGRGMRMYVNKEDLMADASVCGAYSMEQPKFQAMLKHFNDLKADGKAFSLTRRESAVVVQFERFQVQHGLNMHIAQVKLDGLLLWIDQTGIESDREAARMQ
jgi:hypothetical protein